MSFQICDFFSSVEHKRSLENDFIVHKMKVNIGSFQNFNF